METYDHSPVEQPPAPEETFLAERSEALPQLIEHWEQQLADSQQAVRIAMGALGKLYQERSLIQITERTRQWQQ